MRFSTTEPIAIMTRLDTTPCRSAGARIDAMLKPYVTSDPAVRLSMREQATARGSVDAPADNPAVPINPSATPAASVEAGPMRIASAPDSVHNVIVDAWLRSAAQAHDLERMMSQTLPALRIQDRSVVLRTVKLLGRVLDAEGRSARSVPLLTDDSRAGR
ncbi:hypothetical protein [Kibdelosporangium phytohabitans]|nr:hypothetical protein [Kibdelosporangium phytohabitans]MBE1461396.1 hypothetical protein [Kibdelosporangium phytohabitans]